MHTTVICAEFIYVSLTVHLMFFIIL